MWMFNSNFETSQATCPPFILTVLTYTDIYYSVFALRQCATMQPSNPIHICLLLIPANLSLTAVTSDSVITTVTSDSAITAVTSDSAITAVTSDAATHPHLSPSTPMPLAVPHSSAHPHSYSTSTYGRNSTVMFM